MSDTKPDSIRLALIEMLRQCADYLASLPDSDIDALLIGETELRLSITAKKSQQSRKPQPVLEPKKIAQIADKLRSLASRDEGERFLKEQVPTRAGLEAVARHLDVVVRRGDSAKTICGRIIEMAIGFRLSSAAIQGRSSSRTRGDDSREGSSN